MRHHVDIKLEKVLFLSILSSFLARKLQASHYPTLIGTFEEYLELS